MSTLVHPIAGTLPAGACNLVTSLQEQLNLFCRYMDVPLNDVAGGVILSRTAPAYVPSNPQAWLKLDSLDRPERLFFYAQGYWLALHPLPQNAIIWTDQAVNTWSSGGHTYTDYDGGDLSEPTLYTGSFWEVVYGGYFPLAVGTTPAPYSTVIALGATGGEEKHLLLETEIPSHDHTAGVDSASADDVLGPVVDGGDGTSGVALTTKTGKTGGGLVHNNMPPYVGLYMLRRTGRLWYSE